MNLRTIKSNVARWLRPTEKDKTELTRRILERLRYNRQLLKRSGTVWDDEAQAQKIAQSRRRRLRFWLNQRLISAEKRSVEPIAKWVYGADLFKIIDRLSPTLEALGVIAIPLVLFFATQRYQDGLEQRELEKLQQETVANYLNQLSTILLDVDGDLRDPQNEKLRTLTTATTLTLLSDPNLDGKRRSQVMRFLRRMKLVDRDTAVYGPNRPDDMVTILDFSKADLRGADLSNTSLHRASFVNADFREANLRDSNLREANLSRALLLNANLYSAQLDYADLHRASLNSAILSASWALGANLSNASLSNAKVSGAVLSGSDLSNAFLRDTDLRGVILANADLRNADLNGADLRGAWLHGTNFDDASLRDVSFRGAFLKGASLSRADLRGSTLSEGYICETALPKIAKLDPDRDCEILKQRYPQYFDDL